MTRSAATPMNPPATTVTTSRVATLSGGPGGVAGAAALSTVCGKRRGAKAYAAAKRAIATRAA